MSQILATWPRKIGSTIVLTFLMVIGGLMVDPSYLQHPIGEDQMGVLADEGYSMPVTTESSFIADGIDPIQIDIKSEKGDFSGDVEIIGPDDRTLMSRKFALRHYPASFMPNPAKWQSFLAPTAGKGTYKLRITQENPGKAKVFFYQGPFLVRFIVLPIIAAFIVLVLSLTFNRKPQQ